MSTRESRRSLGSIEFVESRYNDVGFLVGDSIKASNGSINYQLWGKGDAVNDKSVPLAIGIHGLLGTMSMFEDMAPIMMEQGFNFLSFDLYGFGLSESPKSRFTIDFYVRQTMELLRLLGYSDDKQFYLIGFSLGGLIASQIASEYPSRVLKVLLIAPAGFMKFEKSEKVGINILKCAKACRIPITSLLSKLASKFTMSRNLFEPDVRDPTRFSVVTHQNMEQYYSNPQKYAKSWFKAVRDIQLSSNKDAFMKLSRAGVPVLIFWGDCDNAIPLQNCQEDLRLHLPNCQIIVIAGAGHSILLEHYPAITQTMINWFQTPSENQIRDNIVWIPRTPIDPEPPSEALPSDVPHSGAIEEPHRVVDTNFPLRPESLSLVIGIDSQHDLSV